MTDFEAATLAYHATTLTYQYAGLWVSGGVGAAQCLLIGFGLWVMYRSADRRDRQHAALMDAEARRHEESMAALEERHEEFTVRHEEFMVRHEEFMATHREVMATIEKRHEETMAALSNNR